MPTPATLDHLLTHAAYAPLTSAWLRITGDDRTRWLNGMATNAIQTLAPGDGCYTFFLNPQGRIQADATVFAEPDALLLQTSAAQLDPLTAMLDRYIIMDDVELTPTPTLSGLLLAGPDAEATLAGLDLPIPATGIRRLADTRVAILRTLSPLVPRFELWSDAPTIASLTDRLETLGIPGASPETVDQLRILQGTPLFGIDIRDRDLPQETTPAGTPSPALHFSKGCYLGQEIVERIHSRGSLHRTFSGFTLTGEIPPPGTTLVAASAPDKAVGELTSIATVRVNGTNTLCALGYVRRETLDRAEILSYPNGTATPTPLPFSLT